MGANSPYFPDTVKSDEEAIQYLGMMVLAMRSQTYTAKTGAGPVALTAAEMVGGTVQHSGETGAVSYTSASAADIIARMQALDSNAGVGSTANFAIVNDNTTSGAITLSNGGDANVTIVGSAVVPIAGVRKYQIKILTATTVSLTNVG